MDFKVVIPILGFDSVEALTLEPIDDIFFRLANRDADAPSFTLIQPAALRGDYVFDLPKARPKNCSSKAPTTRWCSTS